MSRDARKPLVYLAVVLPTLVVGGIAVVLGLTRAFALARGAPAGRIPDVNGMLIALPAFFAWIPVALLLSNLVLHAVPPLRRIAEAFQASASGMPDYRESQRQLLRLSCWMALMALPLVTLGFWL